MDQNMQMVPEQAMKVSPTLIMVNQLLALSSLELQHAVLNELEDNPALESLESITCTSCGAGTTGRYCPVCMQPIHAPNALEILRAKTVDYGGGSGGEDYDDTEDFRPREPKAVLGEDDFDPLTLVATESSMTEQLLSDLAVSLPAEDYFLAEYLVGNLDEQGFLGCDLAQSARELDVPLERLERVLEILQRVAPVGVGARNLRECLLLQLHNIKDRGYPELIPHVEQIVTRYLTELGEHKFTIIAQALGVSYDSVVAVRDFIKKHLEPRPLQEPPRGRSWRSPSPTRFVMPDVIIHMREDHLEPEVVEGYRFSLRVNPLYQKLATDGHGPQGPRGDLSDGEKDHIKRYVNRSKLFISNINQRRETIRRITACLIDLQEEYIRYGVRFLKPLTRAQVAQYLGIHESTVSRATAAKYIMLPDKRVIPFSDFFSASLSAKDVIKEIITKEGRPMTDKEIVSRLREQGIRVARRTVTKYRNQLGILPSTFR
ncbi:MAG: polymerase sigma-54 factor [Chloroflexia bacterium]|nr:polymerase sigma-54 factor [Chloroflexia bacterium]